MMEFIFYAVLLSNIPAVINLYKEWFVQEIIVLSLFVSMLSCVCVGVTYADAAKYQAIINRYEPIVQKYKEHSDRLSEKINQANKNKQEMFTATHDKPVEAWIKAHAENEQRRLGAEVRIDEAKVCIEEIRLGVFGFVVKWVKSKSEVGE